MAVKTERLSGVKDVARAAEILRGGGTVAFPTETVYGLGANALDEAAVGKIFAAKERPGWDPVIVHVSEREMVSKVAEVSGSSLEKVNALMEAFWPGPLTLLLPRTGAVPDVVTAGRPLVGVRMPRHELALALIRAAGEPVAAPSANRFGRTSPTTAAHVLEDLDGRIDAVLDGGATMVGVESTVLDVGAGVVYRPGGVSVEEIERVIGPVKVFRAAEAVAAPESLPSPGVGIRHYAPRARLVLIGNDEAGEDTRGLGPIEVAFVAAIDAVANKADKVGVMLPDGWDASQADAVFRWGPWGDGEALARRLFAGLRELDEAGVGVIVCPVPDMGGIGEAIRDRLRKAAMKAAASEG
jgi:L-threonylcarbamoyladenylate synthase